MKRLAINKLIMEILIISTWDMQDHGMQATKKTPLYFAMKGHKVTFLVHSETTNCPSLRTDLHENLKIIRFNLPFKGLMKIPKLGRLRILLLFGFYCLFYSFKIYRKSNSPDVLYAAESDAIFIGYILNKFLKTTFVTRYYGVSTALLSHPIKHFLYKLSLRCPSDMAIMTDDGTDGKNVLKKVNKRVGTIQFWRNGIDRAQVDLDKAKAYSEKYRLCSNALILVTISRLYGWKRIDRSIKAVHSLIKQRQLPLKLLIVGEGPEKPRLENLVDQLGINKNIEFVGAIPHEEIYNLYFIADIFISGYDMSNVGNPLWEALNAGKCIVALNTGKTSEVIENGINGLLVSYDKDEDKNVHGLAKAIEKLYDDDKLRMKLAQGAQDYGRKNLWSWEDRLNTELQKLEELKSRGYVLY